MILLIENITVSKRYLDSLFLETTLTTDNVAHIEREETCLAATVLLTTEKQARMRKAPRPNKLIKNSHREGAE